jgi:hypothetical protein
MQVSWEARYYDGTQARPQPGLVRLQDQLLQFFFSSGVRLVFDLTQVRSSVVLGSETRVDLVQLKGVPAVHLVVEDATFDKVLDHQRRLYQSGLGISFDTLFKRTPGWAMLVVTLQVAPPLIWCMLHRVEQAHRRVPVSWEVGLGDQVYESLVQEYQVLDLGDLDSVVEGIQVSVLEGEPANALALPGGRVLIFSDLIRLCETPDALAGVLAHEIAAESCGGWPGLHPSHEHDREEGPGGEPRTRSS